MTLFPGEVNLPSGDSLPGTRVPEATSGSDGGLVPDVAPERSDPQIGNPGEETPAAKALRWELAAGILRRELDELRSELARLAKDKCPESDEYPEALFGVAEKLRYFYDRL